jgi:hypothetical protein
VTFPPLDQPQRLAGVPLGHQHQLAADDEGLQEHRHFAGDVEQRHVEQDSISSALPPAVEQGGDGAGLQRRHVADDPARAVAHGDADPVALGDAARGQRPGQLFRPAVEVGEGQPLVARDQRLGVP